MNKKKKLEKILESALSDDLAEYVLLLKKLKKRLPFFSATKRLAAALLKEQLGDISNLDFEVNDLMRVAAPGSVVFEDIKDGKARLFINIGKSHNISPGDLIREIVKHSGIDGKSVGKIDIHSTYSFIEIPEQFAELVLVSLDKTKIRGVSIVVEPAKKRKKAE
ncbi:MAG: DbpA RNA binding domain-containing protein [Spirochaetes bacterium]|nr:DbpA RNA binding domain-containing protein [Spirochaetota bacterium]HPA71688.1 DbpA RNA binding domain-containing protein [Spirochaetota bacterium]